MTASACARRGRRAYAGVAWDAAGYEVVVVSDDGEVTGPRRFAPAATEALVSWLRDIGEGIVTVVDSTNGLVDGRMMAAGLVVYRADPPVLPERPVFGSVPAAELARAAQRDLELLTRLERHRGSQTGREAELAAQIASSAAGVKALVAEGRCVCNGRREARCVALTFDDGPLEPYTDWILDLLERHGIPATFFCVGMNAGAGAAQLARMRSNGHTIGNHTWSHPFLPELSRPQLVDQVQRTAQAIVEVSGGSPPSLFRPPHGARTPEVMSWLADLVGTIVLWDVEADDWAMPGAEEIARRVLAQVRPGSIILLHDGGGDRSQTVAALEAIIDGLLDEGYTFASIDDLAAVA